MPKQNFFPLVHQERKKLGRKLEGKQDKENNNRLNEIVSLTVIGALLSLGVGTLLLHQPPSKQSLKDHPMCGIPTGGQVVYRVLKKNRTASIKPK